jgi:hypothetical protein
MGLESACRTGRVGGTAWASGFDQNKSPFSRVGPASSMRLCVFASLQCLMLLLRAGRGSEELSI